MRRIILACAGLLACCATAAGAPQAAVGQNQATAALRAARSDTDARRALAARTAAIRWLGTQINAYQRATWRWERLMGLRPTPTEGRVLMEMSIPDVKKAVRLWQRRARAAHRRARRPPHLRQFLCIHRYEGSWRDAGGPYYGGLQMDLHFQRTYGFGLLRTKGTADRWTPLEQIWTAEKAHRSRGFWPWPNTARSCGLI